MRPEFINSVSCFLSSASSTESSGYSLRFGGASTSSRSGILCSNTCGHVVRSTGYYGSLNTLAYLFFKFYIYYAANFSNFPEVWSASSPPPKVDRWVKFKHSVGWSLSNYSKPTKSYSCFLPRLAKHFHPTTSMSDYLLLQHNYTSTS